MKYEQIYANIAFLLAGDDSITKDHAAIFKTEDEILALLLEQQNNNDPKLFYMLHQLLAIVWSDAVGGGNCLMGLHLGEKKMKRSERII